MTAHAPTELDLEITGMTCTACAARIEKKLNRVDGVTASVNFATERAHITGASLDPDALIAVVERTGYSAALPAPDEDSDDRTDAELTALRRRLIIAAVLAVPVIALAMVPPLQFDYWGWASLALAAPVVLWAGWPFHRAAALGLTRGEATMDTLISLGTNAAFWWSTASLVFGTAGHASMRHGFSLMPGGHGGHGALSDVYFEVAAGVIVFVLAGRFFERRARLRAGDALRGLLSAGASTVAVVRDGREARVPADELVAGDVIRVRPGETIAADGVVVSGAASVDSSLLTGESRPVDLSPGDAAVGGTIIADGSLEVQVERVGAETRIAQMGELVARAQSGKTEIQRLADRISGIFVPAAVVIAVLAFAGWMLTGHGFAPAMTAAVTVLIIACPCALGLATPTALLVGTGRGAQLGILIRGPEVLESARGVDTVVLDKTGTVTTGEMALTALHPAHGVDRGEMLRLLGALEAASEHPIGRAIAAAADIAAEADLPPVDDFASQPGRGVSGTVEGHRLVAGTRDHLAAAGIALDPETASAFENARAGGDTVVLCAVDGRTAGFALVSDRLRETSAQAVAGFRGLGCRVVLLSGDGRAVAERTAAAVGIDEVVAEVLPEDKIAFVAAEQARGRVVAMVGDGVNDAPALAEARLGIAMGTGSDAAIEAGDITLMRDDLLTAVDAIALSRRTLRVIRGNLFWAFAYNAAAIPLAALGLLNPMIAGAAMAFSSVFVVANSLRLRRFAGHAGEPRG